MPVTDAAPVLAATHVERGALAGDLAGLTDAQWTTPTLCDRWTVEDTVAHLTAAASIGPWRWMRSVLGARFDFDRHNDRRLAEHRGTTPAETLARFRAVQESTTSTWGPKAAWLGEVVVHGEDIRRPLGIGRTPPIEATTAVAEFVASRDFTVAGKTVSDGLRLEATDGPSPPATVPWSPGRRWRSSWSWPGAPPTSTTSTGPGSPPCAAESGRASRTPPREAP